MYLANYWGDSAGNTVLPPYTQAAYRLYRNYDGKNGHFGDTAVAATTDNAKASIYAALDAKKALTMIVINKELHTAFAGKIHVAGADCKSADVFVLDGSEPTIRPMPAAAVKDEQNRVPPAATDRDAVRLSAVGATCGRPSRRSPRTGPVREGKPTGATASRPYAGWLRLSC
jgi:hypothetical protein